VHHLFNCGELLGYRLLTIHNLRFISNLMREIRNAMLDGTFSSFKDSFLAGYQPTDEQTRIGQKQRWLKSRSDSFKGQGR
jgi:tRNA-guanine family transglycosylase